MACIKRFGLDEFWTKDLREFTANLISLNRLSYLLLIINILVIAVKS